MKYLKQFTTLFCVVSLSGCVSAVIAQTGKEEIRFPRNREQIVTAYGKPVLTGSAIPGLSSRETVRWEVYEYHGLMRDNDFANSAATAGGVSLGVSEVISLPSVALNRAASASRNHLFLAEYQRNGHIHPFKRITKKEFNEFKSCSDRKSKPQNRPAHATAGNVPI